MRARERKWSEKSGSGCVERKMTERKRRGAARESECVHGGWGGERNFI